MYFVHFIFTLIQDVDCRRHKVKPVEMPNDIIMPFYHKNLATAVFLELFLCVSYWYCYFSKWNFNTVNTLMQIIVSHLSVINWC